LIIGDIREDPQRSKQTAGGGTVAGGTIQWSKLTMVIQIDGACMLELFADGRGLDWIGLASSLLCDKWTVKCN